MDLGCGKKDGEMRISVIGTGYVGFVTGACFARLGHNVLCVDVDKKRVEPINLGNPNEMTILEMANEVIKATGSQSSISFKPLPVDDPKVRQPDISRARRLLGWKPKVKLEDGLKTTIEWFKQKLTS